MSKHTPGPWTATPNSGEYLITNVISCGNERLVSMARDKANANLIAAAPDLLEALEQITNVYSAMRESLSIKYEHDGWSAETISIDHARKAIARAKGESS